MSNRKKRTDAHGATAGAAARAPLPGMPHAHAVSAEALPANADTGGACALDTPDDGMRLNKAVAASGLCSRRKADELIFAGRVTVDGKSETRPARRVRAGERICVDGRPLCRKQEYAYLLLHKPVHTVCTRSDPQGRPTVMDCLPETARGLGLFPVGRLDYFSEGLLLLTNDGELSNRLTHPRHHVDKVYEVLVRGPVTERQLEIMRGGMRLSDGTPLLPVEARCAGKTEGRGTLLHLVLRQGVNRQIRRMCDELGLTILRLRRVAQGVLRLDALKAGEARFLTPAEVQALRSSAGLSETP